jgi:hypothetical protein
LGIHLRQPLPEEVSSCLIVKRQSVLLSGYQGESGKLLVSGRRLPEIESRHEDLEDVQVELVGNGTESKVLGAGGFHLQKQ